MSEPIDPQQWVRDYEQKIREVEAKSQRIDEAVGDLRVTDRSADRSVEVTVNSAGNLVDLVFDQSIRQRNPRGLAQEVLDCVSRAQQRAGEELRSALEPEIGDSEAMNFALNQVRSTSGGAPPDSGRQSTEDSDYGEESWLQEGNW